jgi:hypothetical protein
MVIRHATRTKQGCCLISSDGLRLIVKLGYVKMLAGTQIGLVGGKNFASHAVVVGLSLSAKVS